MAEMLSLWPRFSFDSYMILEFQAMSTCWPNVHWRGDTVHSFLREDHILRGWEHHTYFVGVGTLYTIDRKSLAMGGWGVVQVRE